MPRKSKLPNELQRVVADLEDRRRWIVWMPHKLMAGTHNVTNDLKSTWSAYQVTLYKRRKYAVAVAKVCSFRNATVAQVRVDKQGRLIKASLPKGLRIRKTFSKRIK